MLHILSHHPGSFMAKTKTPDPKVDALREHASLNPHPQRVSDPLFATAEFFDRRDLI